MSVLDLVIRRPVAISLLTLGIAAAGVLAFLRLPVAPLPQVDYPTIQVQASLPGANPDTMATTVATPLERTLGQIAGVTELTSTSTLGATNIVVQFELDRDIDGAAADVQAAINAARPLLPTGLPSNPTYRKINPADSPIMLLALTSEVMGQGQMYDLASTVLGQRLSQVEGVGQVTVGGSALPAVRVALNPTMIFHQGLSTAAVRAAVASANVNLPKGALQDATQRWQIEANDQLSSAADYRPLIVHYAAGAAVRLGDVAVVTDSVQDVRNAGFSNGRSAVLLVLFRQPGANIIAVVDRITSLLPVLRSMVPATVDVSMVMDRTPTIRAALTEVEMALLVSTALVILVVFLFLRDGRAALIPSVAVPVSLLGTFAVMYLLGFSLNTVSLMALTVATGFVVDDAVVVMENISRHIEDGATPLDATLRGCREVAPTVVSMSLSLVAVFIPILLMGGLVGRLLREFSVTLAAAVMVSLVISLTTTPMMSVRLLRHQHGRVYGVVLRTAGQAFDLSLAFYARTLDWALRFRFLVLWIFLGSIALSIYLYIHVPKGFMPEQDTGRLNGAIQADQGISFQALRQKMIDFLAIIARDPAVESSMGFVGGQRGGGQVFVALKPRSARNLSSAEVIARLRPRLAAVPGATLYLQAVQDIRAGGRSSNAQYQYTVQATTIADLRTWAPRILQALHQLPLLVDVNSDQQDRAEQITVVVDRDTIARLGIAQRDVDSLLDDLFGQRLISTIYTPANQYRVVLEADAQHTQSADSLKDIYLVTAAGTQVPLLQVVQLMATPAPLAVNHQGQFAATTLSFNLRPGTALSDATDGIDRALAKLRLPVNVQTTFQGTAKVFRDSLATQSLLIAAALVCVYVVLGILYESYIHPLTILSTLPSAGIGAILALEASHMDFSLMAMIGVILLIGIVKKNAIMMIDFAQQTRRERQVDAFQAIRDAALLRYRPILMTTLAAMFGALPLAIGFGEGAELRRPLGVAIVGGLALSQLLTLYTTPVVYLYLDALAQRLRPRVATVASGRVDT